MPVKHPGPPPEPRDDGAITREDLRWAIQMLEWERAQPPKPDVHYCHPDDLPMWRRLYGQCP